MKSRVINSKYFVYYEDCFVGYTSELKPSLFYGIPEKENVIWFQSKETNKMSKWLLDKTNVDDNGKYISWTYLLDKKYADKFPELKRKELIVIFDKEPLKKKNRKKKDTLR